MKNLSFSLLKYDIPAALVVYLVALPLCLGIALASGAPLFSGIIAGIVGGIVVGSLSGSHFSVSGPAAGLTTIILGAIDRLGGFESLLIAVILAGILQLIMGFLKAGVIGNYFPSSVIKGMLAAIGIILILKQIPHILGYDKDSEGDFYFFQADGQNTFSEIFTALTQVHPGAILIGSVCLIFLIIWDLPRLKKYKLFLYIPGPLIMIFIGIALNDLFYNYYYLFHLTGEELVELPVAGSNAGFYRQFAQPDFSALADTQVYFVAFTIAIIASLESLLSIEATDKLDPYKRKTDTNRELKAQGVGNIASGFLGGLPITAVIVRSSANINAGAKTKLSSIIHGILILTSVLFASSLLNKIPLASLAALLLLVGYKLARLALFKSMYRLGWDQFLPFIVTIIAIQFSDLLTGIFCGLLVAIFYILKKNYIKAYTITTDHENFITLNLAENVTFINKGNLMVSLSEIPANSKVIINASKSHYIDNDVLEIIHNFKNTAARKNINLKLLKVPEFKG